MFVARRYSVIITTRFPPGYGSLNPFFSNHRFQLITTRLKVVCDICLFLTLSDVIHEMHCKVLPLRQIYQYKKGHLSPIIFGEDANDLPTFEYTGKIPKFMKIYSIVYNSLSSDRCLQAREILCNGQSEIYIMCKQSVYMNHLFHVLADCFTLFRSYEI